MSEHMRLLHTAWFRRQSTPSSSVPPAYPRIAAAEAPASLDLYAEPSASPSRTKLVISNVMPAAPVAPVDVLRLAAQANWPGEHPVGQAIVAAWRELEPAAAIAQPEGVWQLLPGRGIKGYLHNCHVFVGNQQLMHEAGIPSPTESGEQMTVTKGSQLIFVGARAASDRRDAHCSLIGLLTISPLPSVAPDAKSGWPGRLRTGGNRVKAYFRARAVAGSKRVPWRIVAGLGVVSAVAGLYGSTLRVGPDEVVIVRRLGRLVETCGPGLHFRSLWPVETRVRLQPGAARHIQLMLGADRVPRNASTPVNGELARPEFVLATLATSTRGTSSAPAAMQLAPLHIHASVEYCIGDPVAYALVTEDPDALLARWAESTLRALLEAVPVNADALESVDYSEAWTSLLTKHTEAIPCGLHIQGAIITRIELAPGPQQADVAAAVESIRQARANAEDILAKARAGALEQLNQTRSKADRLISEARQERPRRIGAAHAEAERLGERISSGQRSPAEAGLQLIRELMTEHLPGRRITVINETLGAQARLSVQRSNEERGLPLWVTVTSRPANAEAAH